MEPTEGLVWYADSDDPYYTLKHSGGVFAAMLGVPFLLGVCIAANKTGPGAGITLLILSLPLLGACVFAVWEFIRDRRRVVALELTPAGRPDRVTVRRVNGTSTTSPLASVRRMEVFRTMIVSTPRSSIIRLVFDQRLETSRKGRPDLPERWTTALAATGVDLQLQDIHPRQQGRDRLPTYRRTRAWRNSGWRR
ncbi:hypothetical protein [Rugosimonospora africana]|uniref:Uncharacterized protein n=1 Tax=Rugosimonospora africana TaxID=556532 RepID=A0A8J3VSM0_9ACTN|nr:hypothetical protein [Rugosimonospora africana]GIH16751.1 hypothetical protein Raf01_49230 [Rugosimonospora africana]